MTKKKKINKIFEDVYTVKQEFVGPNSVGIGKE